MENRKSVRDVAKQALNWLVSDTGPSANDNRKSLAVDVINCLDKLADFVCQVQDVLADHRTEDPAAQQMLTEAMELVPGGALPGEEIPVPQTDPFARRSEVNEVASDLSDCYDELSGRFEETNRVMADRHAQAMYEIARLRRSLAAFKANATRRRQNGGA